MNVDSPSRLATPVPFRANLAHFSSHTTLARSSFFEKCLVPFVLLSEGTPAATATNAIASIPAIRPGREPLPLDDDAEKLQGVQQK
jgi:hypothetical protein